MLSFVLAARLGDERQVGVLGQRVAQALRDEDLPRRVRKMLLGADHVRDFEIVIVDDVRQVIDDTSRRPAESRGLARSPTRHSIVAADQVVKSARALARHLQPHHGLPPFGLELGFALGGGLGHPAAAVDERPLFLLGRFALGRATSSVVA